MSDNFNIRPVYFTKESWDIEQKPNRYGSYTVLNNTYVYVSNKIKKYTVVKKKYKCSICLEYIYIIDKWSRLSSGLCAIGQNPNTLTLICNHKFHNNCITKWLDRHNTCPLCRREV